VTPAAHREAAVYLQQTYEMSRGGRARRLRSTDPACATKPGGRMTANFARG
jgi:hypothetical protein